MRQVYQENSKLGDPQVVNTQLTECMQKLEKLEHDLTKYQSMLSSLLSTTPGSQKKNSLSSSSSSHLNTTLLSLQPNSAASGQGTNGQPNNHRSSISDNSNDSVSRSESETSLHNHSNGSNGSYGTGTGTGTSLMQVANSLFNKYSLNSATNSSSYSSITDANNPNAGYIISNSYNRTNGNVNGCKTSTPTINSSFAFINGRARSDQDL